ncbi:HD domain-containing protein [candidate division KSB1 bacterium]|nr:HD domain-containing protein [candidate division KSB1 bacterium]
MKTLELSDPLFKRIGVLADQHNLKTYVVGGYVRDLLLGKRVKDIDFLVEGEGPAFAKQVAQALNSKKWTVYKQFGTAMVQVGDKTLEFVGARAESYRGDSRNPNVVQASLDEDLARRDFTINAMAVSLNAGQYGKLFDHFNGLKDLQHRRIRTPLEPEQTLYDDPLRILRAIRFATQLEFHIERNTLAAIKNERQRLSIITQERITEELLKMISADTPSIGLEIMEKTGVLNLVIPEVAELRGVDQVGRFQHKDVFKHTLQVLDNVAKKSSKIELRLSALFHDIAKPQTKEFKKGIGWTFHGHEELGAKMVARIGKKLRLSNETISFIQKITRLHLRPIHLVEEGVTDSAIRRLLFQAGEDLDDLLILCRADITSKNPKRVAKHLSNFDALVERMQQVEEKDRMRAFQPPVRGDEIMQVCHIDPGPLVGVLKKQIEEAIINGEIPNEHDAALEYLLNIKDDILKDRKKF